MTYPPQGGQQQMPPAAPYGHPQPQPQKVPGAPSKAMGITAVVFAILAALVALAGAGWSGFNVGRDVADNNPMTRFIPLQAVAGGLLAVGAVMLLVGAVMHGKRRKAGSVVLAVGVAALVASAALGLVDEDAFDSPAALAAGVIGLLAVVLAFRSRFWLLPKQPAYPQQYPGYPPGQPGYGQHPQQWR